MTFREAIRKALDELMTENKDVFMLGEDIGTYGGCFKVTQGLLEKHPDQVIDTPVSEETFTGLAVASAMMGMHPVVEIMYADFFTLISDPVINHAAKTHFMSGSQFCCPITIRLPEGSGTGHGPQHTQSPESYFFSTPGLKLVCPSNASDAYHLLKASVKDNNPVLFFEHKLLYDLDCPISDSPLEIGKAKVLKRGKDITIISYSHAVQTALETASLLEKKNISATVLDLCTLAPLDKKTILEEVQKTQKAVIIQDLSVEDGICPYVSSLIASDEKTFKTLKKQVLQIGGKHCPIPFSQDLEQSFIPSSNYCLERIIKFFN